MNKERIVKIGTEVSRFLLALVFIFSGAVKSIDPVGGIIKIEEYLNAFGLGGISAFSDVFAYNLSAVEFTLGICLLLGVYRRFISFLTLLFMCIMTPLTLYLALFDPVSDCGCFGDAILLTNWQTFGKNIVLLGAALVLFIYNRRVTSFYTYKVYWFVVLFSYCFSLGLSYYCFNHLPLMDFRPYKIGRNIAAMMHIPEGAPQDEYAYSFIYEKEGKEKEFSLEEAPLGDSTWVFIESKTKLLKKGFTPIVPSFSVYNTISEDLADRIWNAPGPMFLLISPKLEYANDHSVDDINDIYDYAEDKDIPFYCLTASSDDEMENWRDYTGADYPFLVADETQLKTVIRSNPGLLLLNDGNIRMKWHYNDIPEEGVLSKTIEKYLSGYEGNGKEETKFYFIFGFIVPLLLVWLYDYYRIRPSLKRIVKK